MGKNLGIPATVLANLFPRMSEEESLDAILRHICMAAVDLLGGADDASVTLSTDGHATTLGATHDLSVVADAAQYEYGGGPCLDAAHANQVVVIADMTRETRWPVATRIAAAGARSSISLPLPVQGSAIGALNVYSRRIEAFDASSVALGNEFAAYAAVAVANAVSFTTAAEQARQLRAAMEHRSVIEQAKGILIATTGCDAEAAFHLLVQQSQHENRKLREIAADLVTLNTGAVRH